MPAKERHRHAETKLLGRKLDEKWSRPKPTDPQAELKRMGEAGSGRCSVFPGPVLATEQTLDVPTRSGGSCRDVERPNSEQEKRQIVQIRDVGAFFGPKHGGSHVRPQAAPMSDLCWACPRCGRFQKLHTHTHTLFPVLASPQASWILAVPSSRGFPWERLRTNHGRSGFSQNMYVVSIWGESGQFCALVFVSSAVGGIMCACACCNNRSHCNARTKEPCTTRCGEYEHRVPGGPRWTAGGGVRSEIVHLFATGRRRREGCQMRGHQDRAALDEPS